MGENMNTYKLKLLDLERDLPIISISDKLDIASFVILGDTELVEKAAAELAAHLPPEIEYLVCPEAKAIPLVHSIATKKDLNYIVLRKSIKAYMKDYVVEEVRSITTTEPQKLVINGVDIEKIKGKKVAVIDDVVSTGGTISAAKNLLRRIGTDVVWQGAILWETDDLTAEYPQLFYIQKLPLFYKNK